MSLRFFEGNEHAKAYVKFRPVPPPNLIQRITGFLREKYNGPLDLAVDLGCGNGQCTFTLKGFTSVLGTDISPAQITEARELCNELKCDNVKFEASPAEKIPVSDNSVQLITICEAAHWMDLPKVYDEARRVLEKNGVLAIVGYLLPEYTPVEDERGKAEAIKQVIEKSLEQTRDYWPPQIWSCLQEYSDVTIPFNDFTRERGFPYQRGAKIADIIGCIRSYSPFQNMVKDKGEAAGEELLDGIANQIIGILNEGREKPMTTEDMQNYKLVATWNYFVLMARV